MTKSQKALSYWDVQEELLKKDFPKLVAREKREQRAQRTMQSSQTITKEKATVEKLVPNRGTAKEREEIAKRLWAAYIKSCGGVSKYTGHRLPEWSAMEEDTKEHWFAMADAVL